MYAERFMSFNQNNYAIECLVTVQPTNIFEQNIERTESKTS